MKRALCSCLLALGVLLGLALTSGPVSAVPYGSSGLTLSTYTPTAGGHETIIAKGYRPGSRVTILIERPSVVLGSAAANANGVATRTVRIPDSLRPGSVHVIEVKGSGPTGSSLVESATVTIRGGRVAAGGGIRGGVTSAGIRGDPLAVTTSQATGTSTTAEIAFLASVGVAAVGLGLLIRRRHRKAL